MSTPSPLPPPESFKGDWITPEHADYTQAIARWAANATRRAAAVAFVRDEHDVVQTIQHARKNKLALAVRGGGHNIAGSSSITDGIVIDLSRYLVDVTVDEEKKLAHVGGGALWKTVDETAIKYGLATPGGTINHTGVGGLTLGGGFGHLSGEHGHVVENVKQVTIVTADGSILKASETEHIDLFWAVRGSGSNFGVVTEFVLQLYPQRPTVFAGTLVYPKPVFAGVLDAMKKWWEDGPSAKESLLGLLTVTPAGQPVIVVAIFFNGSESEGRERFKAFYALNPVADTLKEVPYEQVNGLMNPMALHGLNYYIRSTYISSIKPSAALAVLDRIGEIAPATGFHLVYFFELIPLYNNKPSTEMAFTRWDPKISTMALAAWKEDGPGKLDRARGVLEELVKTLLKEEDKLPASGTTNIGYANYVSSEDVAVEVTNARSLALYGDKYSRLQALKKQYDPESVFNKWHPIVPA